MRDARVVRRRGALADSPRLLDAMVAAALVFIVAFVGYPVFYNLVMSFQEVALGNLRDFWRPFAGLANYAALLADPAFALVALNTLVFTAANVILQMVLGFALALFFNLDFPGARWMRGLILAGWILPPLVIAAIFKWLFATNGGLVNEALMGTGLLARPATFLSDPASAMPIVIGTNVWFGMPFSMILISAGLSNLPREVYEAAAIDGAGRWHSFRYITLPGLRSTTAALMLLIGIWAFGRAFTIIFVMTGGGPAAATETLVIQTYVEAFRYFRLERASALGTLVLILSTVLTLLYLRMRRDVAG